MTNNNKNSSGFLRRTGSIIVSIIIVLVIIQMFLEELSASLFWSADIKTVLLWSGLFFDLFFTIDFLSKSVSSMYQDRFFDYLWKKMGWVDFLASVPLLLFISGPNIIALITGTSIVAGGRFLNIFKLIRAIRMARILRLLRALRIIPEIKLENAVMTQRHVTRIAAMTIVAGTIGVFIAAFIGSLVKVPSFEKNLSKQVEYALEADYFKQDIKAASKLIPELLLVRDSEKLLYARYSNDIFNKSFIANDYLYIKEGNLDLFLDLRFAAADQAFNTIRLYIVLLSIFISIVLFYGSHFAVTVTDPIFIIKRGITENDYNLRVKIPSEFKSDEIFQLSKAYNNEFLTLKASSNISVGKGLLDMDSIIQGIEDLPDNI